MKRFLFLGLLATACGPGNVINRNDNNGDLRNLTFNSSIGITAAGSTANVTVSYSQRGPFTCVHAPLSNEVGLCSFSGKPINLVSVTDASCDGVGCSTSIDNAAVSVLSSAAQTVKLHVTALMDDGSRLDDSTEVVFLAGDRIEVACTFGEVCAGPHVIFVGSELNLLTTVMSGSLPLESNGLQLDVQPEYFVDVSAGNGSSWWIGTPREGDAVLTFSYGSLTRSISLRIAAPNRAVSGELHLLSGDATAVALPPGIDADTDVIGAPIPSSLAPGTPLLPVWRLADGTLAVGGADGVRGASSNTEIAVSTASGDPGTPLWFTAGALDGGCPQGPIQVAAIIGGATLDATFDQTCP